MLTEKLARARWDRLMSDAGRARAARTHRAYAGSAAGFQRFASIAAEIDRLDQLIHEAALQLARAQSACAGD